MFLHYDLRSWHSLDDPGQVYSFTKNSIANVSEPMNRETPRSTFDIMFRSSHRVYEPAEILGK